MRCGLAEGRPPCVGGKRGFESRHLSAQWQGSVSSSSGLGRPGRNPGKRGFESRRRNVGTEKDYLAARVREGLKHRGMTQSECAGEIDISAKHLSNVLNGKASGSLELWQRLLMVAEQERLAPPSTDLNDFAKWLDGEALRLKAQRERLHGGTRERLDLIHWADALQWAAKKARESRAAGNR